MFEVYGFICITELSTTRLEGHAHITVWLILIL